MTTYDIGDPEPPAGVISLRDYTDNDGDDSPFWGRTDHRGWKGYKNGGKVYLTWDELMRRWGPLSTERSLLPICGNCGRQRTITDATDYNPLQVVTGQPLGWYSADDGEFCPQCMTQLLRNQ